MAMTVKSGRWSDPTVWDTGVVPGAGEKAEAVAPHHVLYDLHSDAILDSVMTQMGSKLTWDSAKETRLRANTVMLSGITEIVDKGLSATPGKPKHEIVFHPITGKDPGAGTGLGAMFMGPTRIHGYSKKGHLRSGNISIPAGATTIHVPGLATSGWKVGDVLVILGTEYVPPVTTDPQYSGPTQYYEQTLNDGKLNRLNRYQFGQDEQRTIAAISGDTITLNAPLDYTHTGMTGTLKQGQTITVLPVIANVSRSIRFRTATAEEDGHLDPYADITKLQRRAHLMFMRQPDVDLRYFETKNMGRTSTDPSLWVGGLPYKPSGEDIIGPLLHEQNGLPIANPDNVRGRYAIHLHGCGGPYLNAPMVALIGATAWAPIGGHPIPGWAITQHGTRAAIEDCVVSNVRGAGMVSELGNETGQWVSNVVTGCRSDGDTVDWDSRMELLSNHNGSTGVAYENQSRAILQHGNIAGSSKHGWLWLHQKDHRWNRGVRNEDLRLADPMYKQTAAIGDWWQDELNGAHATQIPPFHDNEVHACGVGFEVNHRLGGESGPVKTPLLMERFHCLNVPRAWTVPRYSNTYYQKDCLFQAPSNAFAGSVAVNAGPVTWDFNFTNCLFRNYATDVTMFMNYDGFFVDVLHEGPGVFSNDTYRTFTGASTHATKNVMGEWIDHPTDPNQAIPRRMKSYDRTELPLPYPLEPYGRKLPANRPDGTPYPPVAWGEKPYFVLGDGTNGVNSTVPGAINLTLTPGTGRNQGRLYGIIRDSVGDRRYPDWQSNETFPTNFGVKTAIRDFMKMTPEQVIMFHGCWNDGGPWKVRTWFPYADRSSLVRTHFMVDWTLAAGFESAFLARHDLGGPPPEPEWPDKLEAVPAPRPLTPIASNLRFLSRAYLEAVDGQALSHRLRPNVEMPKLELAGGTDAALFRIENQRLVWAGSQPGVRATPYEVIVRATDVWGNTVETLHQVVVIPSARVSPLIVDSFDRANENLEANPAYTLLTGTAGGLAIVSNRLSFPLSGGAGTTYDLGSLGTSEQEISVDFPGTGGLVLMRMVDENNWIGFGRNDLGGGNLEVFMCVNGTQTKLANLPNSSGQTVICKGDRIIAGFRAGTAGEFKVHYPKPNFAAVLGILDLDPLAEPGALILPANAPKGTKIGLRKTATGTTAAWIDNFSARALDMQQVSVPTAPAKPAATGYVLDGDSLTNPSSGSSSYSPMLATNTGLAVTNKAVAGRTLADRNATWDSRGMAALYSATGTNTLVLLAGINDILSTSGITLATMQADMTAYIGKAKAAGFRVLVGTLMVAMGATGSKETLRLDFNTWLRAEAGNLGVEVIDFANVAGLTDPINDYFFTDGLHPAPRGHARMAEAVRVATGVAAVADTTPDAFSFPAVARAARSSVSVSDHAEILGITKAAPISVSGGEYSINGGAFTSAAGQVLPRDLVRVRVTTPAAENQTVSATLTVGGVSATYTATTLTVDPTAPAGMIYPMDAGQGDMLRDDTGRLSFAMARDVVWRTAPVGVSYVTGGLNRAVATVDDPTLLTRPLLMGVIFRLASISGTRQLLSSDETGARIFQFRVKDGKPALQVWTSGSNSSTIQAVDAPVAANTWYLATAFMGGTSSLIRLNGSEIASGTHAARVNTLGSRPYLVMGARGNNNQPGNWPDVIQGDIIAAGVTPDATSSMIAAFETKLRAIATAKGISLP